MFADGRKLVFTVANVPPVVAPLLSQLRAPIVFADIKGEGRRRVSRSDFETSSGSRSALEDVRASLSSNNEKKGDKGVELLQI